MSSSVHAIRNLVFLCGAVIVPALLTGGCSRDASEDASDEPAMVRPQAGWDDPAPVSTAPATAPAEPPMVKAKAGWDDLQPVSAAAGDWPWWRGPSRNNIAVADQDPPTSWGENRNIVWKTALPGKGHGTPCIWGERIFLAAGDADEEVIWMLCFDRKSGNELWRTELHRGNLPEIHKDNSYASATAACDGERVFFPYQVPGAIRLAALDFDGKIVWDVKAASYKTVQGFSASPTIYKSAVIVPADCKETGALTAIHRRTGEVVWRVPRPRNRESYASALAARVAGRDQLFIIGPDMTRSYDPACGELLWECEGPAEYDAATVAFGTDTVYSTGGYSKDLHQELLAIRADGSGDVSASHVVWRSDRKSGYVPSPLLTGGFLYAVNDKGLMRCYRADSGKVIWEHKMGAPFYSSPVLVGDKIYVFSKKGKGFIVIPGVEFKLLSANVLPEGVFATPVICGDRIYLRTFSSLYCLGNKQ